jgi:hypothetical protein
MLVMAVAVVAVLVVMVTVVQTWVLVIQSVPTRESAQHTYHAHNLEIERIQAGLRLVLPTLPLADPLLLIIGVRVCCLPRGR